MRLFQICGSAGALALPVRRRNDVEPEDSRVSLRRNVRPTSPPAHRRAVRCQPTEKNTFEKNTCQMKDHQTRRSRRVHTLRSPKRITGRAKFHLSRKTLRSVRICGSAGALALPALRTCGSAGALAVLVGMFALRRACQMKKPRNLSSAFEL